MRRISEAFTKVSTHVVSLWFEDVGIAQTTYGKLPVETIGTQSSLPWFCRIRCIGLPFLVDICVYAMSGKRVLSIQIDRYK